MIRHAKAATAGSTKRQAGRPGRIVRGALATPGASRDLKGSDAFAVRLSALAGALLSLIFLAATFAPSASAAPADIWTRCDGSPGDVACNIPRGIVADPNPPGHVYVADQGNQRIVEYTAWGEFVRTWGWGVQDGSPELQVCTTAASCQGGTSGGGAGQLNAPQGLAMDSAGDIYVVDRSNFRIQKFTPEGAFLRTWGGGVISGGATGSGDITEGSATISSVTTTSKAFLVGQRIEGAGIPAETTIAAVGAGTITLSAPATETNAATAISAPEGAGNVPLDEVQTVTLGEAVASGNFKLRFAVPNPSNSSLTTENIPFNASAAEVQERLEELASISPGDISVSSPNPGGGAGEGGPYTIAFDGPRFADTDVNQLVRVNGSPNLNVTGNAGATVATQTNGASSSEICTVAEDCKVGVEGAANGQFGNLAFRGAYLAITPDDKVHVGDVGRIQRFDTEGAYQGEIPLPGETVYSLAAAPSGDLYVAFRLGGIDPKPNIAKLSPAGANLCAMEVAEPQGLTTDEAGSVYVVEEADGTTTVQHSVRKFDSACKASADADYPFQLSTDFPSNLPPTAIATGAGCLSEGADLYVGNSINPSQGTPFLRAYGPAPDCELPPALAPEITDQWAASVDSDAATVRAAINPHFWTDTTFQVQYATAACIEAEGWEGACVSARPTLDLNAGPVGSPAKTGAILLTGLEPSTSYRFRFIAQSGGGGPVIGEAGTFTTSAAPAVPAADGCANAELRQGASASLPDCRAYEMVSPIDKNGGDIVNRAETSNRHAAHIQSSLDGDKLTYSAAPSFGDQLASMHSNQYIATRGEDGWANHGINAPQDTQAVLGNTVPQLRNFFKAFTPDLCTAWIYDLNLVPLTPAGVEGEVNFYARDNCGTGEDSYEWIGAGSPSGGRDAGFMGASEDGSHVIVQEEGNPGPIYDRSGGESHLVSVLPGGEAAPPSIVGAGWAVTNSNVGTLERAVSADGSRIFWTVPLIPNSAVGTIYARIDGTETKPVSGFLSEYRSASIDGSKVLYTDFFGGILWVRDVDTEASTMVAGAVKGVMGASEDLSRIYFISTEALGGENSEGDTAVAGKPNLYLDEEGAKSFIGTLDDLDAQEDGGYDHAGKGNPLDWASRVDPSGSRVVFNSLAQITGFDNTDAANGKPNVEVFTYEAGGEVHCVSCDPRGTRPEGRELREPYNYPHVGFDTGVWAAGWIPTREHPTHYSNVLSENGNRLFFHANVPLVPTDTNGAQDLYQWQVVGEGSCSASSHSYRDENGGCIDLISSGKSPKEVEFFDASPDGDDVFFSTASSLDPRDPGLIDVYDARVGGGYPPPEETSPCVGDSCQSPPAPPAIPSPASATFRGKGDPGPQRSCATQGRRAAKLSRRAKKTRRAAKRIAKSGKAAKRAKQMRRRSAAFAKRAKRASRSAKRCRRARARANANRGGAR